MKIYYECGKYCGDVKKGSKLLKGLKFCCSGCEVSEKKNIFEEELEIIQRKREFLDKIGARV